VTIFPTLCLPAMFSSIPPLMMIFPATLPLGKQLSPPILGRAAVFAVVVDRLVQSEFCFFDGVPASVSLVCMYCRSRGKQQKSSRQNRPCCRSYESSVQSNLLSYSVSCEPESSQMLRKVGLPFDTVHTVSLIVYRQQSIVEFLTRISRFGWDRNLSRDSGCGTSMAILPYMA
jgi:hypothetical protein